MTQVLPSGSIFKNTSWNLLGNIYYAATQWFLLVVISKIGNVQMVGQFSLCLALTAPILMLFNMQLRAVQATDIKEQYSFQEYFGLRIITSCLAFVALVVTSGFIGYSKKTIVLIIVFMVAKVFESLSDIVFGLLQKNEVLKISAISQIIKGTASLIILTLLLYTTNDLQFSMVGLALTWIGVFFWYDLKKAKFYSKTRPIINLLKMKQLMTISLPLGITLMLFSLSTNMPRYFIERSYGEEILGYFSALSYIVVAGSTVVSAIGQATNPRLAKYYVEGNHREFKKLMLKIVSIGVMLGLLGVIFSIFFGKWFLSFFYSSDYANYIDVFKLLMLMGMIDFIANFLGYGLTATKKFKSQQTISMVCALITLILSIILIKDYSLIGAVYTLIISSLTRLILQFLLLIKK